MKRRSSLRKPWIRTLFPLPLCTLRLRVLAQGCHATCSTLRFILRHGTLLLLMLLMLRWLHLSLRHKTGILFPIVPACSTSRLRRPSAHPSHLSSARRIAIRTIIRTIGLAGPDTSATDRSRLIALILPIAAIGAAAARTVGVHSERRLHAEGFHGGEERSCAVGGGALLR